MPHHHPPCVRHQDRGELEAGVKLGDQTFMHQHRLQEQGIAGRQMKTMAANDAKNIVDHRADGDLPYRASVVATAKLLDIPSERGAVDMAASYAQLIQRIDLAFRVLAGVGEQRPGELLLDVLADRAHHAEVDHTEPIARLDEEVPRMWIGMEEAVAEDHLQHHPGARPGNLLPVDAGGIKRGEVIDLDAGDALERQYPAGALIPEDAGEMKPIVAGEVGSKALGVAAFADVVGLGAKRLGKLLD